MRKDDRTTSEWLFDGGWKIFIAIIIIALVCIFACLMLAFFKEGGVHNFCVWLRNFSFYTGAVALIVFGVVDCVGFVFRCAHD